MNSREEPRALQGSELFAPGVRPYAGAVHARASFQHSYIDIGDVLVCQLMTLYIDTYDIVYTCIVQCHYARYFNKSSIPKLKLCWGHPYR